MRAGEEGRGGHRCFRRTKDTGRVATGQKRRDYEEQNQGLGRPPVPMPLPGLLLLQTSVRGTTRSQCGLQVGVLSTC